MKRKFLKNLALLLFLNLLIKPFWIFAIDRSVQNYVGSSEYGFYFSLFSFSLLFNILLDLGITNFNNRSLSQDPSLLKDYLSNILVVKILLGVVYGLISLGIGFSLGYSDRQLYLLIVLLCNQFLSSFLLYLRSNISGLQFYTTDSIMSVVDRSIMIVLCSLALWGKIIHQPLRIEWFVYIQTVSYLLAIAIVSSVMISKTGLPALSFDVRKTLKIIRQIAPFALLGLLMSVYNRTDSVLLERLLPDGQLQAGVYAQSYRILDALSNFSLLFAGLLLPMFAKLLATREDFVQLLKTSFSLLFIMCITLSFSCFAFSKLIIKALYHEGDAQSALVFSVLILSFIPISLNYIFGSLLTANGSLRFLNIAAGLSVVLNVFLNLVLIKHYKALGAAIANLVTQSLITLAEILICSKIWHLRMSAKTMVRYLLFLTLSAGALAIFLFVPGLWPVRFAGAILVICTMSLFTGILSIKQLIKSYQAIG